MSSLPPTRAFLSFFSFSSFPRFFSYHTSPSTSLLPDFFASLYPPSSSNTSLPWQSNITTSSMRLTRLIPFSLTAATVIFSHVYALSDSGWLNLTIIHTNDIHARVDPVNDLGLSCSTDDIAKGNCYGGAARHKVLIQKLRRGKEHSLLLDGGDEFQGTMFYTYFKGNVTAEVMNDLDYDLTTIGNHEWDDGPAVAARFWQKLNMPIVCANVDLSKNPDLANLIKPYHVFEDLKLAIIGYITPNTGYISNSGPTIAFTDPVVAVQKSIDELQARGIKRILALSHNGYLEDMDLAAKTRGLDLIVGGHSHSYLGDPSNPLYQGPYPTVVENLDGENTLIVQAYCWGRFIGDLNVSFNPDGKIVAWSGGPIQVEYNFPADPDLLRKIDGWRSEFAAWAQTVLGQASESLDMVDCITRDCQMGNFVTDAMLRYVRDQHDSWHGQQPPWADVAIINTGGIRAGILKGDITNGEVITVAPFGNYVVQTPMKGQELLDTLEAVVEGSRNDTDKVVKGFIQVSGLRFSYDSTQRNLGAKTAEIQDRTGNWKGIDADQTYSVVTLDFLLRGGDNIFLQQSREDTIQYKTLDQVLTDIVRKIRVVTPYLDGRIRDGNDSNGGKEE